MLRIQNLMEDYLAEARELIIRRNHYPSGLTTTQPTSQDSVALLRAATAGRKSLSEECALEADRTSAEDRISGSSGVINATK